MRGVEKPRDEVATETMIDDAEHVAIELGRHTRAVVVGRLEPRDVLDQVDSEQEVAAVPK